MLLQKSGKKTSQGWNWTPMLTLGSHRLPENDEQDREKRGQLQGREATKPQHPQTPQNAPGRRALLLTRDHRKAPLAFQHQPFSDSQVFSAASKGSTAVDSESSRGKGASRLSCTGVGSIRGEGELERDMPLPPFTPGERDPEICQGRKRDKCMKGLEGREGSGRP